MCKLCGVTFHHDFPSARFTCTCTSSNHGADSLPEARKCRRASWQLATHQYTGTLVGQVWGSVCSQSNNASLPARVMTERAQPIIIVMSISKKRKPDWHYNLHVQCTAMNLNSSALFSQSISWDTEYWSTFSVENDHETAKTFGGKKRAFHFLIAAHLHVGPCR